jgi:hypothetical protein
MFVRRRKRREETLVILLAKPIQGCGPVLERVVLQYHSLRQVFSGTYSPATANAG